MKEKKPRIDCHRCKHYFVTWDERFPHGCRAMRFKGRALPSTTVLKSSNMPCMLYVQKRMKNKAPIHKSPKS